MSIPLIVGGVTYAYPTENDELWANPTSDWAQAITTALQQIAVSGDIGPVNLVTIANNQSTPASVTNLILNPANIRAGFVEYFVQRTASGIENSEAGYLYLLYNDLSASWSMAQTGVNVGNTGITFSVNPAGQVRYTTDNLASQTSGTMKYRLRVLQKI